MIASLGMYDLPAIAGANAQLWALIRNTLRADGQQVPDTLTRAGDLWDHWNSPGLVLSQTCGAPFRNHLRDRVTLIGTPDYGIDGCGPGEYCSVFVVRRDDARADMAAFDGAAFAYNDAGSQSGWHAPQVHAQAIGITLRPALHTGAHQLSALAVATGQADIAALDAVTWRLLLQHDPVAAGLRVLTRTHPTPGLPFIAATGAPKAALFAAIGRAIASLPAADRDALGLRGIVDIPAARYFAVRNAPSPDQIALRFSARVGN